jgi:hypothetical protein
VGTSLHGFQAGLDYSLGHSFGLELAVNGHYGSLEGVDLSRGTIFAGPRYAWRGDSITPFVTLLGGVVRTTASIEVFDVSIGESDTDPAGALAAGLDVKLKSRWALRLEGAVLVSEGPKGAEPLGDLLEEELKWDPRATLAVVYRIGSR